MNLFVTYFDKAFYSRGLEMIKSIKSSCDYEIMMLALDKQTELDLKKENIPNLTIFNLDDVHKKNLSIIKDKSIFFTLTADFCAFCMNARKSFKSMLYIDADIKFYQSIDLIFDEVGESSVAFTRHRHPKILSKRYEKYGKYNVGINYFKNDKEGNNAIKLWQQRCIEALNDKTNQRLSFFSDQVLVDDFDIIFKEFHTIEHIGINTAPWNVINYKISKDTCGQWLVDGEPLICFHFSNLIYDHESRWDCSYSGSLFFLKGDLRSLYLEYISLIGSSSIAALPGEKNSIKTTILSFLKRFCRLYIYKKELQYEIK